MAQGETPAEVGSSGQLGRLVDEAGLVNLLGMGGASCVHSRGCAGVAQADLERLIALVRTDERERCAKVCEALTPKEPNCVWSAAYQAVGEDMAAAIRSA